MSVYRSIKSEKWTICGEEGLTVLNWYVYWSTSVNSVFII